MKKTKVFYAVQVSNFTIVNGTPKWLLKNDACMNICIGIVSSILDAYPDEFEFLIKLPSADDTSDVEFLAELFDQSHLDRIEFMIDKVPFSPVTSRYHFDMFDNETKKKYFDDVDVMINDENTLAKNWRIYFNSINRNIPIVSTNYFMDSPISPKSSTKVRYYERQMEALICSDMFSYPVQSALDEALEAYDFLYKSREQLGKPTVWNIGAFYKEVAKGHVENRFDKITIYFGNRITDSANRYTNWHIFAEAIGHLHKLIPGKFEAVILNPTRKITDEQLEVINDLSHNQVKVLSNDEKFTRDEYIEFINHAHISCNLFTNEVHGGLTHVEAMMAGCILVAPKLNDYLHKYEDSKTEYPFLVDVDKDRMIDMESLVSSLYTAVNAATDKDRMEFYSDVNKNLAYQYASYENSATIIAEDLRQLVKNK